MKLVLTEPQLRSPSSLHLFPGRKEFECVFPEVTFTDSPRIICRAFMDSKNSTKGTEVLSAVHLYSVCPWESMGVMVKAETNYFCVYICFLFVCLFA